MIAEDFEYAGEYLKDWGYMICSTDSKSGFETIKSDSTLTFNTSKLFNGKISELTTTTYEDHIEINFQICKIPCMPGCDNKKMQITTDESRELKRWLNRPTFHRFKLLQPDWSDIFMQGSFNVSNIEVAGEVYALDLTFVSNSALAFHEPVTYRFDSTMSDKNTFTFFDSSDEIGYIYPDVKITCLSGGDLKIHNSSEDRTTIIKNCSDNEELYFSKELLLSSSLSSHKIQNDFNYIFLRISNSYGNRKNTLTFSLPVKMEITYTPYVKAVR